jgi:hypothetical protein
MKLLPAVPFSSRIAVSLFPCALGIIASAQAQPESSANTRRPVPYPTPSAPEPTPKPSQNTSPTAQALAITTATSLSTAPDVDAAHRRVRLQLKKFTDWLVANNAKGYIGEVGWPNTPTTDAPSWSALADVWYGDADAANLWVTAWATGEWWGTNYNLSIYEKTSGSSINSMELQAPTLEAHPATANYNRGINDSGGEFGTGSGFSNANPGSYNFQYHYDSQGTFTYLAGRGIKLVRIPFRWERLQPTLNAPLNAAELQRLKDVVTRARTAGLEVVLDMHNYARYVLDVNGTATSKIIGSPEVPISAFQDVWTRISTEFKSDSGVYYGLLNEPHDLSITVNGLTGNKLWEKISQDALNAIRANGDTKLIMVSGSAWSGAQRWNTTHPTAWITDSANNFRYEAHHYWDPDSSGNYDPATESYAQTVTAAQNTGIVANPPSVEVIQDNADTTGVDLDGSWVASTATTGYYGTNYIHDNNTGKGTKRVLFQPALGSSGNYNVYMRWTAGSNRATNVPVDILTVNGVVTVTVNEQLNGGQWVLLGNYPLSYTNAYVAVRTTGTNGYVIADAVKFTP